MRLRFAWLLLAVAGLLGLGVWRVAAATPASGVGLANASAAVLTLGGEEDKKAEYIGSKKCKKCHKDQYKSWEETTHAAESFNSLKAGVRAEAKEKAELDPNKDYTKDEGCLKCHVTAYGHEGGYFIPDEADENTPVIIARLEGQ